MKITPFWASIALLRVQAVLAQTPTSTAAAPSCTASLITTLCSYPEPLFGTAVASTGISMCWDYCNAHQPCSFVIFLPGNPTTGAGDCWLYPGESFDPSQGSTNCGNPYLSVYGQPVCSGGTPTSGGCAATSSPSAVATVCGYAPPADCFDTCAASSGASECLSLCASADVCNYAVFNPHNDGNSPYYDGTCWMYDTGTFDPSATTTCSGAPNQFVYENPCPKPPPPPSTATTSASSSVAAPSNTAPVNGTGSAGSGRGGSGSGGSGSGGNGTAGSGSSTSGTTGTGAAGAAAALATGSPNSASAALLLTNPLAIFAAVFLWQGFA